MGAPGPPEERKSFRCLIKFYRERTFQPNFYEKTKPIWVEIVAVTQILMVARDAIDVTLRLEGRCDVKERVEYFIGRLIGLCYPLHTGIFCI